MTVTQRMRTDILTADESCVVDTTLTADKALLTAPQTSSVHGSHNTWPESL